jgi:phosphohistidine swiveling domain-containing protein
MTARGHDIVQRSTTRQIVLPLGQGDAALELAGGKGASLTRMAAAGLPVPPGFILITEAYRQFLGENDLEAAIAEALGSLGEADPASWERVAASLQARFEQATIPPDVTSAASQAYATLEARRSDADRRERPTVAVRSSATAEDLPGASFAGQQETFLNVRGEAALLGAIRRCWASLWTARALAYRHRLGVDHTSIAMAAVVQEMVPADVAGVLFTANPTTGERSELLVNASYGLGEAIVSGQVTPDTYTVDRATGAVTATHLGSKELMIVAGNGASAVPDASTSQAINTLAVPEARRREPALSEPFLRDLVDLAVEVERLFDGVPQDIEWAVAGGRCWLLQARPITGLPPVPLRDVRWEPPIPGSKWIRRQVVEHMPEPLSPLFEELYLRDGMEKSIEVVLEALKISDSLDRIAGRPVFASVNLLIQRPVFATINGFAYQRADVKMNWRTVIALLGAMSRGIPALFREGVPNWRDRELPRYLASIEPWKARDPAAESDARLLQGVRELAAADARYWFAAALAIGTAKVTDSMLDAFLAKAAPGRQLTSGRFLQALSARGLESDAALERIADLVRGSERLQALVAATPPERLRAAVAASAACPDRGGGAAVLDALDAYFDRFGHLIYSLDFAVPTQVDDPLPVLVTLRALAERPGRDPEVRIRQLARERDELTRATARSFDPIRRRLFRLLLGWARRYAPYREEALFYVGAAWPTLRRLALELGRRLAEAGSLDRPDDVFYLDSGELEAASAARAACPEEGREVGGTDRSDLARLARERRELREARQRLVPPPAVPPAYRFRLGPIDLSARESSRRNTADDTTLRGFAVSPGRVTAPASVIHSPAEFGSMQPGTVLVCPTTTPAWTPLFSQARALVTDIGGVLAHGSIVAREYGIPAVMGTGTATRRITSGQQMTVDGDTGTVTLGS